MAEEEEVGQDVSEGGGKSKLVPILIGVNVLLAGGFGAYVVMGPSAGGGAAGAADEKKADGGDS